MDLRCRAGLVEATRRHPLPRLAPCGGFVLPHHHARRRLDPRRPPTPARAPAFFFLNQGLGAQRDPLSPAARPRSRPQDDPRPARALSRLPRRRRPRHPRTPRKLPDGLTAREGAGPPLIPRPGHTTARFASVPRSSPRRDQDHGQPTSSPRPARANRGAAVHYAYLHVTSTRSRERSAASGCHRAGPSRSRRWPSGAVWARRVWSPNAWSSPALAGTITLATGVALLSTAGEDTGRCLPSVFLHAKPDGPSGGWIARARMNSRAARSPPPRTSSSTVASRSGAQEVAPRPPGRGRSVPMSPSASRDDRAGRFPGPGLIEVADVVTVCRGCCRKAVRGWGRRHPRDGLETRRVPAGWTRCARRTESAIGRPDAWLGDLTEQDGIRGLAVLPRAPGRNTKESMAACACPRIGDQLARVPSYGRASPRSSSAFRTWGVVTVPSR